MAKASPAPKGAKSPPAPPSQSPSAPPVRNGNRPVHTIRYRGCEAAIWKNTSDKGDSYTVTLRKSWRDEQSQWHDSPTFLAADLPMLAKAITDAHSWIMWQERQSKAKGGGR